MATYLEKLRDPRWQKRRLEIMDRADFTCESCGFGDKTLNVHHRIYRKGVEPWDYPDSELQCLCENCHTLSHRSRQTLNETLAKIDGCYLDAVVGYAKGLYLRDNQENQVAVENHEEAAGIADCFHLSTNDVISNLDAAGSIKSEVLCDLCDARMG